MGYFLRVDGGLELLDVAFEAVVINHGPDTLSYGSTGQGSEDPQDAVTGSTLVKDASVTLTGSTWLRSAGRSRLWVEQETELPPEVSVESSVVQVESVRPAGGSDNAAFTAAFAALGADGGTVHLKQGRTYTPTSQVQVPSKTIVEGNGAIFKPNIAGGTSWLTNDDHSGGNERITFRNLIIDGSLLASDTGSGWTTFIKADDVHFENCTFQNIPVSALSFDTCLRPVVDEKCRFYNVGTAKKVTSSVPIGCGVILQDTSDGDINGTFEDVWQIPVFISSVSGESARNDADVHITRCNDNGVRTQPVASDWDSVHHNKITVHADRVRVDAVRLNGFDNEVVFAEASGLIDTATTTNGSATLTSVGDPAQWAVGDPIQGTGIPVLTLVGSIDVGANEIDLVDKDGNAVNATASGSVVVYTTQTGIKTDGGTRLTVHHANVDGAAQGIYVRADGSGTYSGFDGHTETVRLRKITVRKVHAPLVVARVAGTESMSDIGVDGLDIDGGSSTGSGVSISNVDRVRMRNYNVRDAYNAGMSFATCTKVDLDAGITKNNQRSGNTGYGGLLFNACIGISLGPLVRSYDDRSGGSKTQEYGAKYTNACDRIVSICPDLGLNAGGVDHSNTLGTATLSGDTGTEVIRLERASGGKVSIPSTTGLDNSGTLTQRGKQTLVGSSTSAVTAATFVTGESQDRLQVRGDGMLQWSSGAASVDTNLYRASAGNRLATDDHFVAVDGIQTKTKAGAPSDADFAVTPTNGTIVIDTTNSKIYVRIGGTWKATAALT